MTGESTDKQPEKTDAEKDVEALAKRLRDNADAVKRAERKEKKRLADPNCHVLDLGAGRIDVVSIDNTNLTPRILVISGRTWEHVGEDSQGRWIYRS